MTMSKGEISRIAQAPLPDAPATNLVAALARAQAEMSNAALNRVNPHFKSKFADLASVREATLPALTANGLAIVQFTKVDENGNLFLHTRLAHTCGEFVEGSYPLAMDLAKPQAMGSALTYARRYCWASMCGIAAEEDDDANAAQGAVKNGRQTTFERTGVKSANQARKDGDWGHLLGLLNNTQDTDDLRKFTINNRDQIDALPDQYKRHLREAYEARKIMLTEGVDESGQLTNTQKLKASVAAEENQEF